MKIFISWSGSRSEQVASALHGWLRSVIQATNPWMSKSDIEKGTQWDTEITKELNESNFGIICLTPENLNSPWLLFEAGALSKSIEEKTRVCTYLFDLEYSQVTWPLAKFQHTLATKDDTKKMIYTINRALGKQEIPLQDLDRIFEKWWPDLDCNLKNVANHHETRSAKRDREEVINEILELVRGINSRMSEPEIPTAYLGQGSMDFKLARPTYQDIAAHIVSGEIFEVRPEGRATLRGLKSSITRTANNLGIKGVQYGETQEGTLLVWRDRPNISQIERKP